MNRDWRVFYSGLFLKVFAWYAHTAVKRPWLLVVWGSRTMAVYGRHIRLRGWNWTMAAFLTFGQLLCEQARPFPFLLPQTEPTESGYIYPKKARIKAPSWEISVTSSLIFERVFPTSLTLAALGFAIGSLVGGLLTEWHWLHAWHCCKPALVLSGVLGIAASTVDHERCKLRTAFRCCSYARWFWFRKSFLPTDTQLLLHNKLRKIEIFWYGMYIIPLHPFLQTPRSMVSQGISTRHVKKYQDIPEHNQHTNGNWETEAFSSWLPVVHVYSQARTRRKGRIAQWSFNLRRPRCALPSPQMQEVTVEWRAIQLPCFPAVYISECLEEINHRKQE